jgi:hypothetical protein
MKPDWVIRSLGKRPLDVLELIVETFGRIQVDDGFDDWV